MYMYINICAYMYRSDGSVGPVTIPHNQLLFVNPQRTCMRGLQYSVCLSVSQSVAVSHESRTW